MRANQAPYAYEVSSHFFFRDFYYCDSGMLSMLYVLEVLGKRGQTLGQAVADLQKNFPASEERNFLTPTPAKEFLAGLEPHLLAQAPAHERIDGLSLTHHAEGWHANLRASSNEPLLRLNAEARTTAALQHAEATLVNLLRQAGAVEDGGH